MTKKNKIEILVILVLTIAITYTVFHTLVFITFIPTESMLPTLQVNETCIFVRSFQTSDITAGDIVLFEHDGTNLVKRIIACPGDTVLIKDGAVYINGEKQSEPYITGLTTASVSTFEVPKGCYFVMGDNREHSYDSRAWEDSYLEGKDIKGILKFSM